MPSPQEKDRQSVEFMDHWALSRMVRLVQTALSQLAIQAEMRQPESAALGELNAALDALARFTRGQEENVKALDLAEPLRDFLLSAYTGPADFFKQVIAQSWDGNVQISLSPDHSRAAIVAYMLFDRAVSVGGEHTHEYIGSTNNQRDAMQFLVHAALPPDERNDFLAEYQPGSGTRIVTN